MRYPIAIEQGSDSQAFGVIVPDLPGCFSAGDTLDEAVDNAKEAIDLWLETVIDDGGAVPSPKNIAEHQANPESGRSCSSVRQGGASEYHPAGQGVAPD